MSAARRDAPAPAPHGQAARPHDRFVWITDPLDHWADARPDRPAIGDATGTRGYGALRDDVDALAARLTDAGVRPGDRVSIVMENSRASVTAILAAARLRAWAVPLNARLSAREVDTVRDHCRPRALLYTAAVSPDAKAHGERQGATGDVLLDGLGATLAEGRGDPEPVEDDPASQVVALIYTSGTTGAPKGVMLTHDNLMFIAGRSSRIRYLNPDDRVYAVLPMSHVFGLASVLLGSLYQGARLDLVARFSHDHLARALAEDGITVFQGVPQMYARLMALAEVRGEALAAPKLRYVSAGGAPLDLDLKRKVEGMWRQPLHNGYGLTETSPTVSTTETDAPSRDDSTGRLLPDVEIRIVAPDGMALPPEAVGEIWVRGRLVMKGYYRDPEQTARVMTEDGWFKSGDLGRLSDGGELYVVGRLKELIIRSGFNVYPPEIEAVVASHPEVALAAVLGRSVPGNQEVVAFVQPVPGRAPDEAALRAFVETRLAPYKRPSEYRVMPELPASATGKPLKAKLKDLL